MPRYAVNIDFPNGELKTDAEAKKIAEEISVAYTRIGTSKANVYVTRQPRGGLREVIFNLPPWTPKKGQRGQARS